MPQDAPADTAGPSSPPPRMPEGWLPQWEGVQRKWYYVQRATGKSQWEIPTEPVILTPSTTPGSIGTGPSQAPPSRPSTNSPQISLARKTLAEKIEAVAERSKTSSSLDAQINESPVNSMPGPTGASGWHSGHGYLNQAMTGGGEYPPSLQPRLENSLADASGYYYGAHGNQPHNNPKSTWPHAPNTNPGLSHLGGDVYQNEQHQDPYKGVILDPQQSRYPAQYLPSNLARDFPQAAEVGIQQVPQPQWQVNQENYKNPSQPKNPTVHMGSSHPQQPYYNSYHAPQMSSNPVPRPIQASNPSMQSTGYGIKHEGPHAIRESYSTTQLPVANHSQQPTGAPMSRSQSYQSGNVFPRGGPPVPGTIGDRPYNSYSSHLVNPQDQYSASRMARTESGKGFSSMVFPPAPDSHGAHYYQDAIVQAGIQQYTVPRPQQGHDVRANDYPESVYPPTKQPVDLQHPLPGTDAGRSRTASSHPQFVSGPWASSTPPQPQPGQQPPARYE